MKLLLALLVGLLASFISTIHGKAFSNLVSRVLTSSITSTLAKSEESNEVQNFVETVNELNQNSAENIIAAELPQEKLAYGTLSDPISESQRLDTCKLSDSPYRKRASQSIKKWDKYSQIIGRSRLFRKFIFKGFGLHFSKNPFDMKSCAFGIKIPITQNFPVYDSMIVLPRVNALVAVNYPFSFRVSFSFSVPIQVISTLLFLVAQQMYTKNNGNENNNDNQGVDSVRKISWPTMRSSDSVTRLGLTVAYRYSKKLGHHTMFGPNVLNLPGINLVRRLLPFVIFIPALFLGLIMWATQTFQAYVLDVVRRKFPRRTRKLTHSVVNAPSLFDNSSDDVAEGESVHAMRLPTASKATPSYSSLAESSNPNPIPTMSMERPRLNRSKLVAEYIDPSSTSSLTSPIGSAAFAQLVGGSISNHAIAVKKTPFGDAYGLIEKLLLTKSPTFGAQVGYYDTNRVFALGYSVLLEFQPFFAGTRMWKAPKPTSQQHQANVVPSSPFYPSSTSPAM